MPTQKSVHNPGFKDMGAKMDDHVKREDKRTQPRRTKSGRDAKGKYDSSGHRPVTKGVRVKRGEPVVYPYGGKPYETITRNLTAAKQWKRTIEDKRDQIGKQVTRESSAARPGCALLTVRASEATALAFKIRAAVKGGQLSDKLDANADSKLYQARITRVLETLAAAVESGHTVTLGVFTRGELRTIGAQRINAKHITRHVRTLESKLAGNR
jgi:hypothetical protein